jgi:PhnB protein
MKLSPCISLHFDGRCEAAFKFYEGCLGGKIAFMLKWGDSPMADQAPPQWREKILHARLTLGNADVVGGDVLPEHYHKPGGVSLLLSLDDSVVAERIFQALAENGTVTIPLQKTFWALRYGGVVDQFGIPWEVNCGEAQ